MTALELHDFPADVGVAGYPILVCSYVQYVWPSEEPVETVGEPAEEALGLLVVAWVLLCNAHGHLVDTVSRYV